MITKNFENLNIQSMIGNFDESEIAEFSDATVCVKDTDGNIVTMVNGTHNLLNVNSLATTLTDLNLNETSLMFGNGTASVTFEDFKLNLVKNIVPVSQTVERGVEDEIPYIKITKQVKNASVASVYIKEAGLISKILNSSNQPVNVLLYRTLYNITVSPNYVVEVVLKIKFSKMFNPNGKTVIL